MSKKPGLGSHNPREDEVVRATQSRDGQETRATPEPERARRPLRVLMAEDIPTNQQVIRGILRARGHHVEVAENGADALERLQSDDFDVVLMDAQMPEMDGLEATAAIRRLADVVKATVPIIATTARTRPEDRTECLAAGMDDYLAKPIDAARLVERVETFGQRRAGGIELLTALVDEAESIHAIAKNGTSDLTAVAAESRRLSDLVAPLGPTPAMYAAEKLYGVAVSQNTAAVSATLLLVEQELHRLISSLAAAERRRNPAPR